MLKFLNYNKRKSLSDLKVILNRRKLTQKIETSDVKHIISSVIKNGDKAVINFKKIKNR